MALVASGLVAWGLLALVAGSFVFSVLVLLGARSYRAVRPQRLSGAPPISVLKPLSGLDEGLEDNLRSFFRQDYPVFEMIFSVRHADDPAVKVVEKLRGEYPQVPVQLFVTGEPPYPNAKVFALERMLCGAHHDLLVMSDSDTRVGPGMLRVIASEFQDERLGLATCPYRAVPGGSLWSTLEAIGMNTEFLAGILVARLLEGMKFGVGPTMAIRREVIGRMGGFAAFKDYLAEDFEMGRRTAELGYGTILSCAVIEHRIGTARMRPNFEHRIRWVRSTRRSRSAGYIGQLFTYPLPLALLLWAVRPAWWPAAALTITIRAVAAWATAVSVLEDRLTLRRWWLLPIEDVLSFAFWIAGFFGNTVTWRGHRYVVNRNGTFGLDEGG
jgi:ceramide glucosyltransferase